MGALAVGVAVVLAEVDTFFLGCVFCCLVGFVVVDGLYIVAELEWSYTASLHYRVWSPALIILRNEFFIQIIPTVYLNSRQITRINRQV